MKIRYNTNGGTFGCCGTDKIPLKEGMKFDGWHSDGYRYNAVWKKLSISDKTSVGGFCVGVNEACCGGDNGLVSPDTPIELIPATGRYGENVYTLKTVYTDIPVDGIRDAAYDYGLRVSSSFSSNEEFYKDKPTGFDASFIRGQDGRVYVFMEVVDTEIMTPDELWGGLYSYWRSDCIQLYFDIDNTRSSHGTATFSPNGGMRYFDTNGKRPEFEYKVVLTDVGYNVEFAFDNGGIPFLDGDLMGIDIFMNDLSRFVSPTDYTKNSLTMAHALCNDKFHTPTMSLCDVIKFSSQSATGNVETGDENRIEATGDVIADILSGASSVAIVSPRSISAYAEDAIRSLVMILKSTNRRVMVVYDTEENGCDCEILVGLTNRPESRALADSTLYNGYAFEIHDKRICLIGWLEEAFDKAYGLFLSAMDYVKNGGKTCDLSVRYGGTIEGIPGENIPMMPSFTAVTDAGGGAYLVLSQNSTEAAFNDYLDALKAKGFEVKAENTLVNTLCTTLCDGETLVNVTFGGEGDPNLRAVVESYAYTALPQCSVGDYKKVSASKIIQVAPNYMCYLIKLDNGEFIAVDSGNNGVEAPIYEQLMKNSEDGHPVIAAWFFSHFHQDHIGGFVDFVANEEYMKNVTVKSVVYNFPEDQVILTAKASWQDMDNIRDWPELIARVGCTPIRARTGQKFIIANAEIDMLYTYEDLMPFYVHHDRTNPTSSVISVKIGGQRLIITGDCCGEATKLMANRYVEGLKTDFVQLPHHGWGDGGTAIEFYQLADAPWVLYPGNAYTPSASERWACEHSERYFLRGKTTLSIPLPYNGEEPEKD